jgi:hypothetical protein
VIAATTRLRKAHGTQPVRRVLILLVLVVAALWCAQGSALASESCPNEAIREEQHSTWLPDCRAFELVSPADKNGGDVLPMSFRTHAAADGNALGFASLVGFADAMGTGVTVDYVAQRRPEAGAWITHALNPAVSAGSALSTRAAVGDTIFEAFSPDLTGGVLESVTPVGEAGNVRDVPNLYVRGDVLGAGAGSYALMSGCPACDANGPLPPVSSNPAVVQGYWPRLAGLSPDSRHAAFESIYDLTSDAPAQTASCGDANGNFPPPSPEFCATRLYEWDQGQVRLAGLLPDGSPADMSFAGDGARNFVYTPHVVSDGSDGHTRVMFTQPTASDGRTFSQLDLFSQFFLVAGAKAGNLFMRVDHAQTVQLNASERTVPDTFAPAQYLDASANGERVFFMTSQALTDDATPGTQQIYLYDTAATPNHLTLVTPNAGSGAVGLLGTSNDGHYAYMDVNGEIQLWHDGTVHDIAPEPNAATQYLLVDGRWSGSFPIEARVTPDGRHLLYISDLPPVHGGYDHGVCSSGFGCRELYVYNADTNTQRCASCNPSGARATVDASVNGVGPAGGALGTSYLNRPLSVDGRFVFFNSAEELVSQAANSRVHAYEFDTQTGRVALLSTGTSVSDSFFMDASADGRDVFIATRDALTGRDTDGAYDIYDARVDGGFPEPPTASAPCSAGTCQGSLAPPPGYVPPGSSGFAGAGNLAPAAPPRPLTKPVSKPRCRRGYRIRSVHGKPRCVKARPRGRGSSRSLVPHTTRRGK